MIQALTPIGRTEEMVILGMIKSNGLDVSLMRCKMTRQQGYGSGVTPRGREYDISYDLMLCEYCGNLEAQRLCPAKVKQLRTRLLEVGNDRDYDRD